MTKFNARLFGGMLCILLCISLQTFSQTITTDLGSGPNITICKGQSVVMTGDSYMEWEVSTDGGYNWNSLGMGEKYASASISNNSKYRGKANDYSSFPPSEVYTNIITFTVNGERTGLNTITSPDRGSLNLNGTDQSFLMTPGFAVNTGAFTFEAWFKMNEAPYENQFFVLLGAGNNFKAVSVIVYDPVTIKYDSWGYASQDFTVPKMSVNTWYHLVMVRDASGNLTVFLNGARSSTGIFNNTSDMTNNTGLIRYIGRNQGGGRFNGQIANPRMVVGSAVYDPTQSSITVPTSPLTNVTNTKLLLLANSDATKATDASGIQTLTADGTAPGWMASSPFRENLTGSRTVTNSVSGGSWSSSNTSIATVDASTGVITPISSGDADITYSIVSGGCTSTAVTGITVAASCTTNSWSGGTGNWNVAGNWSCGTVPDGSTDIAIASGSPTLNTDFTLPAGKSLTLSGSGSLVIAPAKTLTLAGTADFGGRPVTLQSTASGDAAIGQVTGTLSNASQVTVERYIGTAKRAWRLLSIPVTGSNSLRTQWAGASANANAPTGETAGSGTLITGQALANGSAATTAGFDWYSGLTSTSASSIRYYHHNGTAGSFSGSAYTPDITAAPSKQGYMLFIRGDRTVTTGSGTTTLKPSGTLRSGTQSIPVAQAYAVIGNPYAAAIDIDQVYQNSTNSTVITRNFWIWDATLGTAGGFRAISYGGSSYTMTGGSGTATDYLKVRSGGAFFVERNGAGGNISIEENDKIDGSTAPVVFGSGQSAADPSVLNIALLDGNGRMTDGAALRLGTTYKKQADEVYDMLKINNFNENLSIVRDGRYLSIESRPIPSSADTIFLSAWNLPAGNHRLSLRLDHKFSDNLTATLRDAYTGTTDTISLTGSTVEHPFEINADPGSSSLNRFSIVIATVAAPPVMVTTLQASPQPSGIRIDWKTSRTDGLLYSELQGSRDGSTFRSIGIVQPNSPVSGPGYSWLDKQPVAGINHYRVRTLSVDGTARFSNIVTADWNGAPGLSIFPNPATGGSMRLLMTNQPAASSTDPARRIRRHLRDQRISIIKQTNVRHRIPHRHGCIRP
jgi:Concanavalin A-like lectin/glucanases superfamily